MTTSEEKLQEWIINETSFLTEKRLQSIPDLDTLSRLTKGKNKIIWEYILTHVRSKCSVQKIRRMLQLKRDQNNLEKLFPKPLNDFCKLQQEIAHSEDRRKFFKNSLSNFEKEIVSKENALQDIRNEIDKIHQKTAILHLITLHYQEKCALLNYLHGRLSLHLTDKVGKQSAKFQSLNIAASAQKCYSITDNINLKIKHLLAQTESLVVKKFKNCPGSKSLIFSLQKSVDEVFKGVLICDLLFILKEQSNTSYLKMIKRLSQVQSTFQKSPKNSTKRDSEKLLQELKCNHIKINFSLKKIKNDISRLISEKESLIMMKINPFSVDDEYQAKCQLLYKIAENEGLAASISYLEEMLSLDQAKTNPSNEASAADIILNEDIVNIQDKFYNDFDTMYLLQNSVAKMLDYILKRIFDVRKYANEELFLDMTSILQEFPHEVENEVKFENEALWNVLRKNDVVKPMLQENLLVPDCLWDLINVAPFKNLIEVCHNIKLLKDYVSASEKDEWEYDEKQVSKACGLYDNMINVLHNMQNNLNICSENLENGLNCRSAVKTALQEWWEQSAQFIPDIVYDNKTLKMWIDILHVTDGIV